MEGTDYRQLCLELFGTDDVIELKRLAASIKQKNSRHAGRKKKFTEADVADIRTLLVEGATLDELACRYQTSRRVLIKYLNHPPEKGYTMRLAYMYRQKPCTVIDVDFARQKVKIQNRTQDVLLRAFGVNEQPTWEDFEIFLAERCFPQSRGLLKAELRRLGLESYDPLQIVEKTKGRTAEDDMWLKIQYYPERKVD